MEHSVNFARRFSHLVWLLMNEPDNVDEQKSTLRALVVQSKLGAVHIAHQQTGLTANDQVVPAALTGVTELASQMQLHGIALISTDADAKPADLLGVARVLTGLHVHGDGGAAAESKRRAGGITSVKFAGRPDVAAVPLQSPAPPQPAPAVPDMDFEMYDDPYGEAMKKATPRSTQAIVGDSKRGTTGLFSQFAASQVPSESHEALLKALEHAQDVGTIESTLTDLLTIAEKAAADGKAAVVTEILIRVTKREQAVDQSEAKRVLGMTLRRMSKPALLRLVATQMPTNPDIRGDLGAVLARAGEDGADTLVELISDPAHQRDKRMYFDVLVQLKAGVPTLLHMLTDTRWFVVRNAAELLGEMHVREAEGPLTETLKHEDERVRRTANGALMRLGTTRAMQTIQEALASTMPQVRMEAAAALGSRKDAQAVPTLLRALDAERDEEVQAALMLALGRLGTPEALQRLSMAASAERSLFKRKTPTYRMAAVHGLVESRAPDALDALRALQEDKDSEVRNAATFGLRRISRADNPRINEP
ncbi:MAG TPA: HEAT repeat domain-containing protein [Gemmatimonadaceae bacterium]